MVQVAAEFGWQPAGRKALLLEDINSSIWEHRLKRPGSQ